MKSDFIIALTQLAAERNLSKDIVLSAIEAALASAYKRDSIAAGQNISVKLDPNSGDVNVSIVKSVVEQVEDPLTEISLADAKKISPIADLGDNVPVGALPHSAGRIAAQTAKQVVIQRLRDAERDIVFQEYADKVDEVYSVTVQRIESGRQVIVELGRAEAVLPASEQSPYDRYRVGQRYKVLLKSIDQSARGQRSSFLVRTRRSSGVCSRWKCQRYTTARSRSSASPAKPDLEARLPSSQSKRE